MLKFIKNLFTKKKQFTLDDFTLSDRVSLKVEEVVPKKERPYFKVLFKHPITEEWWVIPCRKVSETYKWSLLKKGKYGRKDKYVLRISWYGISETKDRFKTVNDLKIYFDHLEQKYNELHP